MNDVDTMEEDIDPPPLIPHSDDESDDIPRSDSESGSEFDEDDFDFSRNELSSNRELENSTSAIDAQTRIMDRVSTETQRV